MSVPEPQAFTVSTRDDTQLRAELAAWLTATTGTPVAVTTLQRPEGNGMSSDTVLFDAEWSPDAGLEAGERGGSFVARLEPSTDAFPVFPTYDLAAQVRAMRLVGRAHRRAGAGGPLGGGLARACWAPGSS